MKKAGLVGKEKEKGGPKRIGGRGGGVEKVE
jgi:hypothetical protein